MNINEGVDRILTRVSIDLLFFSSLNLMFSRWVFFLLEFSSYAVRTVSSRGATLVARLKQRAMIGEFIVP